MSQDLTDAGAPRLATNLERVVLNPSELSQGMYQRLGFRSAHDLYRLDL